MALINCPECGKQISDRAKTCIFCGYPIQEYMEEQKQESKNEENEKPKDIPIRDDICPQCGNEISPVYRVCHKCGYSQYGNSGKSFEGAHNYNLNKKMKKKKKKHPIIRIISAILAIFLFFIFFYPSDGDNVQQSQTESQNIGNSSESGTEKETIDKESSYKELCEKYDYNDILRNPDSYKKKYCKIDGTVDQIIEGWFGSYTIYLMDDNGNKWGCTYSYKDGESHVLEGDYISVYGMLDGTGTVNTVLGAQVTLPYVDLEYIN